MTTAAPPFDAAALVRTLDPEAKQAVFLALLREALAVNGDEGLLLIDDEAGDAFGYYVPPKAAEALYEMHGPGLTREEEEAIWARSGNEVGIPVDEVIAGFRREAAELERQRQTAPAASP